ncbi:MMPL family protein [Symmachiella macrocystis]|uniref:MMPL family protein n=1 Tax=Symmachiella macrocystis TaxID=2527985 RepID=A0A5C6BBK7_9PLAN|nr:MMPL family protein [Symmachiella macrocystis]
MALSTLSEFYQKHSGKLLLLTLLSFPVLFVKAQTLPANNDIETWLPRDSEVRANYEDFKRDFGVEELIVVGIENTSKDDVLVEAVCERLERLDCVRKCWSPGRMQAIMTSFGVDDVEAETRLKGLTLSQDGRLVGLICLLSPEGYGDRAKTVDAVTGVLEYCQLRGDQVRLAGAPVIVTELDRLGSEEENQKFFFITLLVCWGLLSYTTRQWQLSLALLGLTIWAIQLTLAGIHVAGGEMNFILSALSVMVMIFTLAVSIHFMHYYTAAPDDDDPLRQALKTAWKPCCLATLTTTIGLVSLAVSDILPVNQFGYAAAWGSVVALITGLGLTPALMTIWPPQAQCEEQGAAISSRLGDWISTHSKVVSLVTVTMIMVTCVGLLSIETKIDPLDFLPKNSKVLTDAQRVEAQLTNIDSIEAVVEFRDNDLPFTERLEKVREIEAVIAGHPAVRHTISSASFFPSEMPQNPFTLGRLLKRAESQREHNEYIADGERLWRISARISTSEGLSQHEIFEQLQARAEGLPVRFTGIAPMLNHAQQEIFRGFHESFLMAFLIITGVMVVSLRSWKTAMVAMIPNLTPICIVYGILGWVGMPVDIGMMMSGSIALGIAVDGTFHFLVHYQSQFNRGISSAQASREALRQTGGPIFKAALISSIGMLALTLSSFAPTARFGLLMCSLLIAALVGDLVLLPALLCLRPSRLRQHKSAASELAGPHRLPTTPEPAVLADRVA